MGRVVARFAAVLGALWLAGACRQRPPPAPKPGHRVRVRSFTEATAVRELVTVAPYAFVATASGLDRWDLRSGSRIHLASEHGLPGDAVLALDYDSELRWLWIATDRGVARYELDSAAFTAVPPPPQELGLDSFHGATLAAAGGGGVWIGLPSGLYFADASGHWRRTSVTAPVTDLFVAGGGRVWVGTGVGLFEIPLEGTARALGLEQGCELAQVRFIERGPEGEPIVVGDNAEGEQRVVLENEEKDGCVTYRTSPRERWVAATPSKDSLVVLTEHGLYAMHRPRATRRRRLYRDGMRLLRVAPTQRRRALRGPYVLTPVAGRVPDGAQALAAAGGEILVGTRSLGTALVIPEGRRGRTRWLRRRELARDATTLSVACLGRDDCYLSTGSSRLWHFDGERFADVADGAGAVLAVVGAPKGAVYGIRPEEGGARLEIARIEDGAFVEPPDFTIETPGESSRLTFARASPAGALWLGLGYVDGAGDAHPYGVAVVEPELELLTYHRAGDELGDAEGLPIPRRVIDAAFVGGAETWLATDEGVARIRGREQVDRFGEPEGLRGEPLRGVACSPGGAVYAASRSGVAVFEDGEWTYPHMLGWPVNDLELAADGRLWMATERGLAFYDGHQVRRLDARRGLIEDHIQNVALDRFGRVWIRGDQGIGLVTP